MKSAFREHGALISIGGAILYTIGLNPQRISAASEARFPAHAIPGGLHYQKTGLGPKTKTIEATTFPHVTGGMDSYAILEAIHESQKTVPLYRLRGQFRGVSDGGLCVIETLEKDEEKLSPFDGRARIIDVAIGLIMLPHGGFRHGGRRRDRRTVITNIGGHS